MSCQINNIYFNPARHFVLASGGALVSGLFSYGTYSSQYTTVFKVALIMGVTLSLIVQTVLYSETNKKEKNLLKVGPLAVLGYLLPLFGGLSLTIRSILSSILPPGWMGEIVMRDVASLSGLTLGYVATNALFESYHFYRSRGTDNS